MANSTASSTTNNTHNQNDARFSQATTLNHDGTINSTSNNNKPNNNKNSRASTLYTSQPFVLPPNSSVQSLAPEHPKSVDIQSWTGALSRLQDSRYEKQRYVMSAGKNDEVSKLALGAKVERALGRRLVGQDAEGPANGARSEKEKIEV